MTEVFSEGPCGVLKNQNNLSKNPFLCKGHLITSGFLPVLEIFDSAPHTMSSCPFIKSSIHPIFQNPFFCKECFITSGFFPLLKILNSAPCTLLLIGSFCLLASFFNSSPFQSLCCINLQREKTQQGTFDNKWFPSSI